MKQPVITPQFADLRQGDPWIPLFHSQPDLGACADRINRPHEDYPRRVVRTRRAIIEVIEINPRTITTGLALKVHATVFPEAGHAGTLRRGPVRIGRFVPPQPDLLPRLMENLETAYENRELDADTLASWYTDFETIHPFQDGNGRVGGIIVAALNRNNCAKEWMTPGK